MRVATILMFALAGFAGAAGVRAAEPRLPVFDAHVHYSRPDWDGYSPAKIAALLEAAGVPRALVSSSPDDGTLKLHAHDPGRFVPVLRPYRDGVSLGNWFDDKETPAYIAGRLKRGIYKGIGEFHLDDGASADTPTVRKVAALAVERGLFLHIHSGAEAVRRVFAHSPTARILWAHAGMSEPVEVVAKMLDAHPKLWAELSFREHAVMRGDALDPAWRDLLIRHADRFVVGSDTYVTGRWGEYGELIESHRRYLRLLPPETARAIAYRNAVRLFGSGGIKALEE